MTNRFENASVDHLRLATPADAEAIDALMKTSIAAIFPDFYDPQQTASSVIHIGHVDRRLIEDGTYFVIVEDGDPGPIACGGWSRRAKLFTGTGPAADDERLIDPPTEPARVRAMFVRGDRTRRGLGTRILEACEAAARDEGFRSMILVATLPGALLYERYGFTTTRPHAFTMPDGVRVDALVMEMPVRLIPPG